MLVSRVYPVEGNQEGSFLTMASWNAFIFGIIGVVGNFGGMFTNQAFWAMAIATQPSSSFESFVLGGLFWFSLPFALATSTGLACRALDLPVSSAEVDSGLVTAAVAFHLFGREGAIALLLAVFLVVVSTGSSQQMAVSSLLTYDVYKAYFNRNATGDQIMQLTRGFVVAQGAFMACLAAIMFRLGVSAGWLYHFLGLLVGSSVVPISALIMSKRCSALAATSGALGGQVCALIAWLVTSKTFHGAVDVASLGRDYPMLAGNVTALASSLIITLALSCLRPQNYDWNRLQVLDTVEDRGRDEYAWDDYARRDGNDGVDARAKGGLQRGLRWKVRFAVVLALLLSVGWPALCLPVGVFSKSYFYFWVLLSLVWVVVAWLTLVFLPIWEYRNTIAKVLVNCITRNNPTCL